MPINVMDLFGGNYRENAARRSASEAERQAARQAGLVTQNRGTNPAAVARALAHAQAGQRAASHASVAAARAADQAAQGQAIGGLVGTGLNSAVLGIGMGMGGSGTAQNLTSPLTSVAGTMGDPKVQAAAQGLTGAATPSPGAGQSLGNPVPQAFTMAPGGGASGLVSPAPQNAAQAAMPWTAGPAGFGRLPVPAGTVPERSGVATTQSAIGDLRQPPAPRPLPESQAGLGPSPAVQQAVAPPTPTMSFTPEETAAHAREFAGLTPEQILLLGPEGYAHARRRAKEAILEDPENILEQAQHLRFQGGR